MRKSFFASLLAALLFSAFVYGQKIESVPKTATILETQIVVPHREMILWMPNPTKNPNQTPGEIYTCPQVTRGSYYSGKVFVTLIDSSTRRIVNTIEIKGDSEGNFPDEIDLPYAIHGGYYYKVPSPSKTIERKPQIMALKDYNGDGKSQEFALFDAEACMGLPTTLVGYSRKKDRVIQYPIRLKSNGNTKTIYWIDYLFSKKSVRSGHWKYDIDYRGRAGNLDKYEIRYDTSTETFVGTLTSVSSENN